MIGDLLALVCLVAVAACAMPDRETDPVVDLGDLRLLDNFAVTTQARKMGVTRDASAAEWEAVLEEAARQAAKQDDAAELAKKAQASGSP